MVSFSAPGAPRRKLVVGNWKMNGTRATNTGLLEALKSAGPWSSEICVCVPTPFLADVAASLKESGIAWGAQDCSGHRAGAYTGEVSAPMLSQFGCAHVLVGHSERRAFHNETDAVVAAKAEQALAAGLVPIVCLGETLEEREAGRTADVVRQQLEAVVDVLGEDVASVVFAYEPVWAIGTGKTASPEEAQAVHAHLRATLFASTPRASAIRIVYGGSVKADNAGQLFSQPDIDGGLIGGASLKAVDFIAICRAAG